MPAAWGGRATCERAAAVAGYKASCGASVALGIEGVVNGTEDDDSEVTEMDEGGE